MGVAVFPEDANDLNGILANADTAMYEASEQVKTRGAEHIIPTRSVKVKKTTTNEMDDGREGPDQTASKGFAVVANEVKELAKETGRAT